MRGSFTVLPTRIGWAIQRVERLANRGGPSAALPPPAPFTPIPSSSTARGRSTQRSQPGRSRPGMPFQAASTASVPLSPRSPDLLCRLLPYVCCECAIGVLASPVGRCARLPIFPLTRLCWPDRLFRVVFWPVALSFSLPLLSLRQLRILLRTSFCILSRRLRAIPFVAIMLARYVSRLPPPCAAPPLRSPNLSTSVPRPASFLSPAGSGVRCCAGLCSLAPSSFLAQLRQSARSGWLNTLLEFAVVGLADIMAASSPPPRDFRACCLEGLAAQRPKRTYFSSAARPCARICASSVEVCVVADSRACCTGTGPG